MLLKVQQGMRQERWRCNQRLDYSFTFDNYDLKSCDVTNKFRSEAEESFNLNLS